uniref:ERCC4 domain-containing protein n=1 Tax=Mola mola TaxID=94237 RepID=A0A3Q3VRC7_MOLML
MGSYSDSSSDLEEELAVFDFLSQAPQRRTEKLYLDSMVAEEAAIFSAKGIEGECKEVAHVISSESDEDSPYVSLAMRLKHSRDNAISASSAVTNVKYVEKHSSSNVANTQLSCQTNLSESEDPLSRHQVRTVEPVALKQWLPLRPLTSASLSKRKPAKCTEEDIQASRQEALKRRQARERQQKAERKALAEAAKALRPEECMKHMVVAVDPGLLQLEGGGTLLAAVQAQGCSCTIEKQPFPRSVTWMRRAPGPDDGVFAPEAHVVMQMTVDDIVTLIYSYVQVGERHDRYGCGPTLTSWVQEQQRRIPGKTLSLVIINMEKYFRSQKSQSQKRFLEAVAGVEQDGGKVKKKRNNGGIQVLPDVSRVEVEEAVVHLQLHTSVSVHFLSTWKDFSDHIIMTTKAVAEAPFKREREKSSFSFYLESDWAGGQRVDKTGKGLLQVWKRQIQQLNRVSPDIASAILAAYPSPQLLKKAYNQCQNYGEKISLLSDLLIRRGEGITSTVRRVGPELSKRLFLIMDSCDPEQTVDTL